MNNISLHRTITSCVSDCPEVIVLMSTFNGSAYIAEQIESIRQQTFTDWALIIRDDGSTDTTLAIIKDFAEKDARIRLVPDGRRTPLGPKASFGLLMEHALDTAGHYFCFGDQDDVWFPYKIERALAHARRAEGSIGADTPVLVYSDLQVVNKDLQEIAPSFYAYQGIRTGGEPSCSMLLAQNHVVGCSTLFNRPLLELATPVPEQAYMHDWWIAICARVRGSLVFLNEPTIKYRQHGGNNAGAAGLRRLRRVRDWGRVWQKMNRIFHCSIAQAECLSYRLRIDGKLSVAEESARSAVEAWGQLAEKGVRERLGMVARCRLKSQNALLTLLLYVQLLLLPLSKALLHSLPMNNKEESEYSPAATPEGA